MNAFEIEQLYKSLRQESVPPFWRFLIKSSLNLLRVKLRKEFGHNTEVEFLNYQTLNFDFSIGLLNEHALFGMKLKPLGKDIHVYIPNNEAHCLIAKLLGYKSDDNCYQNRPLSKLDYKAIENFVSKLLDSFNEALSNQSKSLFFEHSDKSSVVQTKYLKVDIQVFHSKVYIIIPVSLFHAK